MNVFNNVPLKEVCKVISGYAFKSATFKTGGSTPVIKIKNIKIGTASLEDAGYVDPSFLESVDKKYKVMGDDILISLTGSHMTQPNSVVGRVGRYPCKYPVALLNQRAGKVIPNEELVDKTYLFYALLGDDVRREIAQMAHGAASQANVSPSQVESVEIPLPDLKLQERIGSVLNNYDQLIENNNRRISILEDMAQSLYREWFVNFRYPNHEDNLDADGNPKLVDSPLGQIPEGWEVKKFSELVNYKTGKLNSNAATPDGEYPFFTCSRETFRTNTFSFDCECVLLAGNNANAVYPIKYFHGKFDAYQRTYVITEKDRNEITPSFLFYCLELKLNQLKSLSTGSATRFLTKGILDNLDLLIPPKGIMKDFDSTVIHFLKSQKNLNQRNDNLKKQRDMLLPKLISGTIKL
ncbi:restriction endonuclease subunit S [Pseudoalteromonas shioyasakiensis]|uniref:restriction endonuclease subunit S n=1 Tax=Pseudoalteromonas shioyasakiensis TaxID=1190813 RepID=UPI002551D1DB|nr:restriction endonuclease subunit S [Pseudoalteromonas shioyasakiensis]MDK9685472.1 restriction endonuclease subunit S [Pseudoalteromonas shioyasakiensis]